MDTKLIDERIRYLAKKQSKTLIGMIENCELNKNFMYDLKKGSMPSTDKLIKISDYFNVSTDYFFNKQNIIANAAPEVRTFTKVPVIGSVKAGFNGLAVTQLTGYEEAVNLTNAEEYRYFEVKGNSMRPDIKDGDLALVHMQPDVENGELAVVIVNGEEGMIKKIQKQDNALSLISFNSEYETRVFIGEGMNDIMIWGKVCKIERKY